MRIKTLITATLLSGIALVGAALIYGEVKIGDLFDDVIHGDVQDLKSVLEMEINLREASSDLFNFVKKDDDAFLQSFWRNVGEFRVHAEAYQQNITDERSRENLVVVLLLFQKFVDRSDELLTVHKRQEDGLALISVLFEEQMDSLLDDDLQAGLQSTDPQYPEKKSQLLQLEVNLHEQLSSTRAYIIDPSESVRLKVDDSIEDFSTWLSAYRTLDLTTAEAQSVSQLVLYSERLANLIDRIIADENAENALLLEVQAILAQLDDQLDDYLQVDALAELSEAERNIETALTTLWIATLASISLAVYAGWRLMAPMTRALNELTVGTQKLARGEFEPIEVVRRDELGDLALAFNGMQEKLKNATVSRDYLDSILEAMGNALFVVGADGRIESVNAASGALLRSHTEKIVGQPLLSFFVRPAEPSDNTDPKDGTAPRAADNMTFPFPNNSRQRMRRKDGTTVPVLLSRQQLRGAGTGARERVIVVSDISEITETERLLIKAQQEAEKSSAAKTTFLASMSHELRTPLNPILGYAEILQQNASGNLTDLQMGYLGNILDAGRHLHDLISNVLDLTYIESGNIQINLSEFDIVRITGTAVEQMAVTAIQRGVTISFIHPEDAAITVHSDSLRIRQVLYNLLSNAIKYTERRGGIWVECKAAQNQTVRISVRDDGPGVPPDLRHTIFAPFTRAQLDAHVANDGIGMGLAICKLIVERLGGSIGYNRTCDGISEFWFTIPCTSPEA